MSGAMSSSSNSQTETVMFTPAPLDLFRMGNASGPRLDNVRLGKDVDYISRKDDHGQEARFVLPTGGLSTFDGIDTDMAKAKWWKIAAGTAVPDTIRIVRDTRKKLKSNTYITHYSLRPAFEMTLETYVHWLNELAKSAVLVSVTMVNEDGGSAGAAAAIGGGK